MYDENNNNLNYSSNIGGAPYNNPYSSYEIPKNNVTSPMNSKKPQGFIKKAMTFMILGLIFGGFGALGFFAVNLVTAELGGKETWTIQGSATVDAVLPVTLPENEENAQETDTAENSGTAVQALDVTNVVTEAMPSVVSIINQSTQTATNFFGQTGTYESETSGSGIIVGKSDSELLIVTNNHVADDANTLSIQFIDGTTAEAKLKGADSEIDLAIVAIPLEEISEDTLAEIKVAVLGDSSSLKVGEPAIAIGNALGYGQSVTTGVISALDREITIDNNTNILIQTDAAINPGNSGGALLNMNGEVIGINAAKFSSSMVEGMGYAIPISEAKPIIDDLINRQTREKAGIGEESYLGISGVDVTEEVAQTYAMPIGIYVAQALDGTAAKEAGIQKGDIITEFDGQKIRTMAELQETLSYYSAGTTIDIVIKRFNGEEYEEKTLSVALGSKAVQQ